ncbi:hypothetical protein C8R44DRAFT_871931 [Mycena epipterygia]|nr:hypothetical protein C8R44DRAFT_871931 [Mycena epipterygia]
MMVEALRTVAAGMEVEAEAADIRAGVTKEEEALRTAEVEGTRAGVAESEEGAMAVEAVQGIKAAKVATATPKRAGTEHSRLPFALPEFS